MTSAQAAKAKAAAPPAKPADDRPSDAGGSSSGNSGSGTEGIQVYTMPDTPEKHVEFGGAPGYIGPLPAGTAAVGGDGKGEGGGGSPSIIRTRVDSGLAIRRMSRDLYSNPTSAVRESLANEMTSAAIAIEGHGAAPRIRIVIDNKSRRFSVHGLDTMGCTWEAFARALAVIGVTTNADPGRAGQMGIGFYANTLLSDTIILDSHARETGERFTAMCLGGGEWQLGLKSAPMPEYGARVSMTVRARVDMGDLENKARKCARLSPCPVSIENADETYDPHRFCCTRSLARAAIRAVDIQGFSENSIDSVGPPTREAVESAMFDKGTDGAVYAHGEKDGVEACIALTGKIATEKDGDGRTHRRRKLESSAGVSRAYLVGMPIGYTPYEYARSTRQRPRLIMDAAAIVVHVKDERMYRPTADRERFTGEAEERIRKKVDEILAEWIASVKWPATLAEHLRSPYRAALDMAVDSGRSLGGHDKTVEFPEVGFGARTASLLGRTPVRIGMSRRNVPLYHAFAMRPRSVVAKKATLGRILAVARHDPSVGVIVASNKADEIVREAGLERLDDYMERAGLAPLTAEEAAEYGKSREWAAAMASYGVLTDEENLRHFRSGGWRVFSMRGTPFASGATLVSADSEGSIETTAKAVVADSARSALIGAMMSSFTKYAVASYRRGAACAATPERRQRQPADGGGTSSSGSDTGGLVAEADFLAGAASAVYHTSAGPMSGEQIASHDGRLATMQYDGPTERLASAIGRSSAWFGRPGTLYAVCSGDEHFALMSLLGARQAGKSGSGSGSGSGSKRGPDVHRVLALTHIPGSEERKIYKAPGSPILLYEEVGGIDRGGSISAKLASASGLSVHGGPRPRVPDAEWPRVRAMIHVHSICFDWPQRMDLLLASLEIKDDGVLAAFASSAYSGWTAKGSERLHELIDGGMAVEAPPRGGDGEPAARVVVDLPLYKMEADTATLSTAKKWHAGSRHSNVSLGTMPHISAGELAGIALARTYHTNNGTLTGREITEAPGGDKSLRGTGGILVYDRDAAGLADALPSHDNFTVAVVDTMDEAIELGCAMAQADMSCRIGRDGTEATRKIIGNVLPRKAGTGDAARVDDAAAGGNGGGHDDYDDDEEDDEDEDEDEGATVEFGPSWFAHCKYAQWACYPAAWHGLLAMRSEALRRLLESTLKDFGDTRLPQEDAATIESIVERFLWMDGQRRGNAAAAAAEDEDGKKGRGERQGSGGAGRPTSAASPRPAPAPDSAAAATTTTAPSQADNVVPAAGRAAGESLTQSGAPGSVPGPIPKEVV